MTADDFVNVLVAEMEADGNTSFVDKLLTDARAQVLKGKGTVGSFTSASMNGKSFARQVDFSAADMVSICRRALNAYKGIEDEVSSTRPDFRSLIP